MKKNRLTKSGRKKSSRKKSLQKSTLKKSPRKWSDKYKKSINCDDPKGFSQRQFCLKKSLN